MLFGLKTGISGTIILRFQYDNLARPKAPLADLAYSRIKALPLKLIDHIHEELLLTAATLKANHPISYADCFAAALAIINRCPLVTGDPEFKSLEEEGVIIVEWLT